ncbi:COX15/CtaA family protein [Pelagibacteraceae bacterium]|jgi:heme a synthase|nr:COX15/CtaA family protein [Pelagibacteraceae bacterium]
MIIHEKKINTLFLYWLILSLILVFSIIIIGGLTRLTNSGLSITEWELFKGIFPPTNKTSWDKYFNLYKEIPQYKLLNQNMNLNDFKIIFYWEYFHRMIARFIGLFFLVPLIYFYISKKINKKYLNLCYLIFLLIILQGLVGWYMVKSGLVNDVTVSHYRLSIHLSLAFFIISIIFWLIINFKKKKLKSFFIFSKKNLPFLILIFIIFCQIILGAFVSGLDAGKIYQTWPMMNYTYFPNDVIVKNINSFFDFNNHSLVQFYHRNLAYLITIYIFGLCFFVFKKKYLKLYKPLIVVIFFLILQIFLGIFTLLSGLNIYLASAHQICSLGLIFSTINLYYFHIK